MTAGPVVFKRFLAPRCKPDDRYDRLTRTRPRGPTAASEAARPADLGPLPGAGVGVQPGGHHVHPPRRLRDRLGRVQGAARA